MANDSGEINQLVTVINNLFFSHENWTWLNSASSETIATLFSTTKYLEDIVKTMKDDQILQACNQQLHSWFANQRQPTLFTFNDFEEASDILMTVFLTDKNICDSALSRLIHHYKTVCSEERLEKLFKNLIAQHIMLDAALTVRATFNSEEVQRATYKNRLSNELPRLIHQGVCSYILASNLIEDMMIENEISLEILLQSLLNEENKNLTNFFALLTFNRKLKNVDTNYHKFWKLIVHLKDTSLILKLAEKYPDFLSITHEFITICGQAMKLIFTEDFDIKWDCQLAILTREEFVFFIRNLISAEGVVSNSTKEILINLQSSTKDDTTCIWDEVARLCLT